MSEDLYTVDSTPECPFCGSDDTLKVRPDIARCGNEPCQCERFWLEQSNETEDDDRSDAFDEIAEIMQLDRAVIEEMAEVAFRESESDGDDDE
jgi:hypothetical protein